MYPIPSVQAPAPAERKRFGPVHPISHVPPNDLAYVGPGAYSATFVSQHPIQQKAARRVALSRLRWYGHDGQAAFIIQTVALDTGTSQGFLFTAIIPLSAQKDKLCSDAAVALSHYPSQQTVLQQQRGRSMVDEDHCTKTDRAAHLLRQTPCSCIVMLTIWGRLVRRHNEGAEPCHHFLRRASALRSSTGCPRPPTRYLEAEIEASL